MSRLGRIAPILAAVGVVWLAGHRLGWAAGPEPLVYRGEAQIDFQGTSTLHDFAGKVPTQPFTLRMAPGAAGRPGTWSAEGDVMVTNMTTFHKERDENMRKMFDAARHAGIRGVVRDAPVPGGPGSNVVVALTLQIRDMKKPIPVTVSGWTEDADGLRFSASWHVSLKEYGLKRPSVLGLIRVGDDVFVTARIQARRAGAASAGSQP